MVHQSIERGESPVFVLEPFHPITDNDPGETANPEMIAIRIYDLEALVLNSVQGEAIRKLWVANEAVDMSGE